MADIKLSPMPVEAERLGSFNAANELNLSFAEPESVGYLGAPLVVYRSTASDGNARFDVCVEHEALGAKQLLGFLKEVAPGGGFESIGGILADWRVVDDVQHPRYKGGQEEARRLVSVHEHLGNGWLEFMKSRRDFMTVLQDGQGPHFISPFPSTDLLQPQDLDRLAAEHVWEFGSSSVEKIIETLQGVGIDNAERIVWDAVKAEVNMKRGKARGKNPIWRPETLARRFSSWHKTRRKAFLRHLISTKGLNQEDYDKVVAGTREQLYDEVTLEDGSQYAYPRSLLVEPLADVFANSSTITDGIYEGKAIQLKRADGRTGQFVISRTVHRVAETVRMSPLITWERDSEGRRSFILERGRYVEDRLHFRDGVLGVLAVAYFSPGVREGWPRRMGIRGGSFEQFMGAAQVPVLALMRKAELLKTDFVVAAESIGSPQ